MKELAVLLLTCDKYRVVAEQNLSLLSKYMDVQGASFYVVSENVAIQSPNARPLTPGKLDWSSRITEALKTIKENCVLIILDDFWPEQKIDMDKILFLANAMKKDESIANFAFSNMRGTAQSNFNIDCMWVRDYKPKSLLNWQAGLWNRRALLDLLRAGENPWESELFGSCRARYYKNYKFFCLKDDRETPFVYGKGWLVVRGKWNVDECARLTTKLGIDINYGGLPKGSFRKGIGDNFWRRVQTRLRVMFYKFGLFLRIKQ